MELRKIIRNIVKESLEKNGDVNYFTTSRPMKIKDFIDIEVDERGNYEIEEVNEWIDKYNIKPNSKLIWVALYPHIAARYQMSDEDWENAKEIYDENPNDYDVRRINADDGILIPESDDGDDGFIFIFYDKK